MKILIYTQCFAPKFGGIESVMTNLAKQANLLKHDVTVLADGSKHYTSIFDSKQKYKIYRFDQLKFLRKKIKSNFANDLCKEKKFDVAFFDSWKSLESFKSENKIKKICLIHGNEILKLKKMKIILNSFKNVDGIIFNSIYTQNLFQKNFKKLNKNKYRIIHPAFIDKIEPIKTKKKYDLCTVARLEYRKGHHLVLESLSQLKKEYDMELNYAILGNGSELSNLKDLVMKYNLIKQVSFIDENTESFKVYKLSKIHVMPTITTPNSIEGFGISNVEAASFGLPCIVSDSGGIAESVSVNGKIIKENNVDELTIAIIDTLKNIKKLSKKSQQFAKKFQNKKKNQRIFK